jgi:hypothetical protein
MKELKNPDKNNTEDILALTPMQDKKVPGKNHAKTSRIIYPCPCCWKGTCRWRYLKKLFGR